MIMDKIKILWVDDEIDLLKPHILFLEKKIIQLQPAITGSMQLGFLKKKISTSFF